MGGNVDDSILSTASSLVDSCSVSFIENDHVDTGKENNGVKSLLYRGKIANFAAGRFDINKGKVRLVSPTTSAIDVSNDWSQETQTSKLDQLRAKTKLLRKQSTQKIEESRASLRKSRTLSVESPQPAAHPPPYPPPSVQNKVTEARVNGEGMVDEKEFSDFLRQSNSVIDRLSTEIAMAGSIINDDSTRADSRVKKKNTKKKKTNDFASNLYSIYQENDIGKSKRHIRDKRNSLRNTSIDEDWCQSTISASSSPPGSPESSVRNSREPLVDASSPRKNNQSGLPPPEVLVKKTSPQASPRSAANGSVDVESYWGTPSTKLALKARFEDRNRKQRQPSVSSLGDCASMYNTRQKCEKLELENDCLRRQLELLESRHRDAQRQLLEQSQRKREKSVPSNSKKKRSNRYLSVVLLVLAPFIILTLSRLYGSLGTGSLSRTMTSSSRDSMFEASTMHDGTFSQSPLGETVFSDKSGDTRDKEEYKVTDLNDELYNSLILDEPPIEFQDKQDEPTGKFAKFANHVTRFTSKINHQEHHDFIGVWKKKHEQISMGQASTMRDSTFSQSPLGETVFSDKSGATRDKEEYKGTDLNDELYNSLALNVSPIQYRDKQDKPTGKFAKFANHITRFTSKINHQEHHDFTGVWKKKHEQIQMKKRHAEL